MCVQFDVVRERDSLGNFTRDENRVVVERYLFRSPDRTIAHLEERRA